jgi:hypothetical protein
VDRYEELRGWVTEALNLSGAPCGEAREALLNALRETPRRAQLEAIEKRRTLYGTALAMLTSGEALRAAFESLHGALGDEVGVNVTTRIVREAVLAAKVAAWTKAAAGVVLEEGRANVIDWLRSDEAGRIAAGAAGDPWYIAGRLADALEGDEQRRAPAAGGGSGARVRVSADAGVRAAQEACSHPHVSAGGPGGRVCYACSAVLPLERAGEPDGLLGEAITRHVYEAIQAAGEMVPAGVEEGAERALRELWDRGVLVGPEEEWPFVHYCRSALREIRDLMSGVEVHESQRGGVCSDCVDAVRQAREFAVRTLAETVPPSVEGGEDGPAVLVVPRPKLDALRLILAVEAHVCSCGDCESQAYADRCRFEAALRELVGA